MTAGPSDVFSSLLLSCFQTEHLNLILLLKSHRSHNPISNTTGSLFSFIFVLYLSSHPTSLLLASPIAISKQI